MARAHGDSRSERGAPALASWSKVIPKERFGIEQVFVRGTTKVTSVLLLASLVFNLLQHACSLCT
jgi:hypothetical protein